MGLLDKLLGPPTKEKFANLFMAALHEAGDTRSIRVDENEFRLNFESEGEDRGVLNLSNLYIEYCNVDKSDRKRCTKTWCARRCRI